MGDTSAQLGFCDGAQDSLVPWVDAEGRRSLAMHAARLRGLWGRHLLGGEAGPGRLGAVVLVT